MWDLYDYKNEKGVNEIAKWTKKLSKRQRIKLRQKLDALAVSGSNLSTGLLEGPIFDLVYLLKVHGNVQLRPTICKGPINVEKEFTILLGVIEKDWKYQPADYKQKSKVHRQAVLSDYKNRRCKHERIT